MDPLGNNTTLWPILQAETCQRENILSVHRCIHLISILFAQIQLFCFVNIANVPCLCLQMLSWAALRKTMGVSLSGKTQEQLIVISAY